VPHFELFDISDCNISNRDFFHLLKHLSRFCTTINVLNLSYNQISSAAATKKIVNFEIGKMILYSNMYQFQDVISLLPHNLNQSIVKLQLEIIFLISTAFILCNTQTNL